MIKGKKILFIGTGFYDYENDIKKQFEDRGAIVYHFSSVLSSWIKRILDILGLHVLASKSLSGRLQKLIEEQPDDIDFIFIIRGENFQEKHIAQLERKYPNKKTVFYTWDTTQNLPNWELIHSHFDNILTFDRVDAEKYNLKFRPLYYRVNVQNEQLPIIYDVSFVGKSYTNRDLLLSMLKKQLENAGLTFKFILVKTKLRYFVERFVTRKIKKEDEELYITSTIDYNEYLRISLQSNVILDIPTLGQNGLTMRTIESIGLNKKLLTTNRDIKNYNFDDSCFRLLDACNPSIDMSFIKCRDSCRYEKEFYSEKCFINDILACFM